MSSVTLKDTEHISLLAATHALRNHNTVWNANPSLKSRRKNPNLLFHGDRVSPGDRVEIPDFTEKRESGNTDQFNVFKVDVEKLFLRLRVLADNFTAIANADYELAVDELPTPLTGKTNAQGQIEAEIPRTSMTASLTVRAPARQTDPPPSTGTGGGAVPPAGAVRGPVPCTWNLLIGALNPIMENAPDQWCIAGVQQRLNNLGINTGPVDGIRGPNTESAVKAFQQIFGLKVDGKPGQGETQPKLVDVHDKPDSVLGPKPDPTSTSSGGSTS